MLCGTVPMFVYAKSFLNIAENLAWDEACLALMKREEIDEVVRIWKVKEEGIVIGRSQDVNKEVFIEQCNKDGLPIIRRFTGGGAVVQGEEIFNYSFCVFNYYIFR